MTPIYYKSEFAIRFADTVDGLAVDFSAVDFDVTVRSGAPGRCYYAARHGDSWLNCRLDDNDSTRLLIVVDSHSLGVGPIEIEAVYHIPDIQYPDGIREAATKTLTDIVLTMCPTDAVKMPVEVQGYVNCLSGILAAINKTLAQILDGDIGAAVPSDKAKTAAVAAAPTRIQRGMMRATAMPGTVYDAYKGLRGRSPYDTWGHDKPRGVGLVKLPLKPGVWYDYSVPFPGGLFYGEPVRFDKSYESRCTLEVDEANHRVRADIDGDGACVYAEVSLPYSYSGGYAHYLTTDADGRVVCAAVTGPLERPLLPADFELAELCDGTGNKLNNQRWAYGLTADGRRLELQWYTGRLAGGRNRPRLKYHMLRHYRRVARVSNRHIGVLRVRLHTGSGHRSDWVYYSRRATIDNVTGALVTERLVRIK